PVPDQKASDYAAPRCGLLPSRHFVQLPCRLAPSPHRLRSGFRACDGSALPGLPIIFAAPLPGAAAGDPPIVFWLPPAFGWLCLDGWRLRPSFPSLFPSPLVSDSQSPLGLVFGPVVAVTDSDWHLIVTACHPSACHPSAHPSPLGFAGLGFLPRLRWT